MASIGFTYVGHTRSLLLALLVRETAHVACTLAAGGRARLGCPKDRGTTAWLEVRDSGVFYISDEPRQLTGAEVPLGVDRVLL